MLLEGAGEEVGYGGEVLRGLGCAEGPAGGGFDVLEGVVGGVLLDEQEADLRVVGGGDLFVGVFDYSVAGEAREGHLHVGLAGGEPEVSDEDVFELEGVGSVDGEGEGASGGLGGEVEAPAAEVVRDGGVGAAVEIDGDLLAGCGAPPDVDGHLALEDHVAGEDFGEGDFGSGGDGEAEQGEGVEQLHDESLR